MDVKAERGKRGQVVALTRKKKSCCKMEEKEREKEEAERERLGSGEKDD